MLAMLGEERTVVMLIMVLSFELIVSNTCMYLCTTDTFSQNIGPLKHCLNGTHTFLCWNGSMEKQYCNGCYFSLGQQIAGAESSVNPHTATAELAVAFG